jgi:hypothetical protein
LGTTSLSPGKRPKNGRAWGTSSGAEDLLFSHGKSRSFATLRMTIPR